MSLVRRIRKVYEDHPYPAVTKPRTKPVSCLPAANWIDDLWQPAQRFPPRILVAGCGTGDEVFAWRRRYRKSEIVGIDFCASSIAIARRRQRDEKLRGIRFVVGDLVETDFQERAGGKFDFISCHGVLAYVPRRRKALQNLAALLAPEGALYLGLNGSGHFSARWRQVLPAFGFDIAQMPKDGRLAKVVALFDSLSGDNIGPVARTEESFLPTDLFGPLIRTVSLAELLEESRGAGLHFLGVFGDPPPFRWTVNDETYLQLMPRSRAEVAEIGDSLRPSGFHRILLGKAAVPTPPWDQPDDLAGWRPVLARHLRAHPLPKRKGPWSAMRTIRIRSPRTNMCVELRAKEWVVEVLRQSRGKISLGSILAKSNRSVRNASLLKHLYLLHQLYFLNFAPPVTRLPRPSLRPK